MQLYDITIAPNTTRQLDAPGSYFYYYTGSAGGADSTITMRGLSSGLRIVLKPGQAFRLPRGENETSWVLTNFSNTATIVGTVIVGDGDITDNRITGSVEVVDGAKTRTITGSAGIMSGVNGLPGAGNTIQCGIWNPAASGKRAIVKQINFASSSTQVIFLARVATAGTITNNSNLLLDGSAFAGATKATTTVTAAPVASIFAGINVMAGQAYTLKLDEPVIVKPGYGLICQTGTVATDLSVLIPFFEESDT